MSHAGTLADIPSRDTRLLDQVTNYRSYVSRTLWYMSLLAWGLSLAFATVHDTWWLAILLGGGLTLINTLLVFKSSYRVASIGVAVSLMVFVSLPGLAAGGMAHCNSPVINAR